MILFPAMSAYVSEIAPEGRNGEYMGLYLMAFSVAFIVGPWLGTFVLEHHGPLVLWAGTLATGLLSTMLLARRHTLRGKLG